MPPRELTRADAPLPLHFLFNPYGQWSQTFLDEFLLECLLHAPQERFRKRLRVVHCQVRGHARGRVGWRHAPVRIQRLLQPLEHRGREPRHFPRFHPRESFAFEAAMPVRQARIAMMRCTVRAGARDPMSEFMQRNRE